MPTARVVICQEIVEACNYELRNIHERQYSNAEMFAYLNKCLELIYQALVQEESEFIWSYLHSFVTVQGQELYPLSGDFWCAYRIWLTGYENSLLEMCEEKDRYSYLESQSEGQPTKYYIEGESIGLLPFPDQVYTVNMKYFHNFVPPSALSDPMPYKNLFNLQIQEGIIMLAKNRESMDIGIDISLMELFETRAYEITKKRRTKKISVRPRLRR